MQDLIYDAITGILGGQCYNYTLVCLNKALELSEANPQYFPIRENLIDTISCITGKKGKVDVIDRLEDILEILKTL